MYLIIIQYIQWKSMHCSVFDWETLNKKSKMFSLFSKNVCMCAMFTSAVLLVLMNFAKKLIFSQFNKKNQNRDSCVK